MRAFGLLTCRNLGLDGLRSLIPKVLQFACFARAQGRHGSPCLSAGDDTLKAPFEEFMLMMDTASIKSASSDTGRDKSSSSSVDCLAPTT